MMFNVFSLCPRQIHLCKNESITTFWILFFSRVARETVAGGDPEGEWDWWWVYLQPLQPHDPRPLPHNVDHITLQPLPGAINQLNPNCYHQAHELWPLLRCPSIFLSDIFLHCLLTRVISFSLSAYWVVNQQSVWLSVCLHIFQSSSQPTWLSSRPDQQSVWLIILCLYKPVESL